MFASPLAGLRAGIFELVRREPGVTPAEVARRFAVDHSTAAYHLRRLARARLVQAREEGRTLRFFAAGCGLCPFLRTSLPHLRDPGLAEALDVAEGLRDAPADRRELARLRGRMARLAGLGLVGQMAGRWLPTEETATCRARLRDGAPCAEWGRCAVSHRWIQAGAQA